MFQTSCIKNAVRFNFLIKWIVLLKFIRPKKYRKNILCLYCSYHYYSKNAGLPLGSEENTGKNRISMPKKTGKNRIKYFELYYAQKGLISSGSWPKANPLAHELGGLGGRSEPPQRGSGRSPGNFCILTPSEGLFQRDFNLIFKEISIFLNRSSSILQLFEGSNNLQIEGFQVTLGSGISGGGG